MSTPDPHYASIPGKTPQFGVMYHLTGSSPEQWKSDFDALAEGGFSRIILWEVHNDVPSIVAALDLCAERALQVYSIPFNPLLFAAAMSSRPEPHAEYKCVGIDGATLEFYNPFHRDFRREILLPYFAAVAQAVGGHPALAGYFIDDLMDADSIISYTAYDAELFREFLRDKYASISKLADAWGKPYGEWSEIVPPRIMLPWRANWRAMWDDWCEARQSWWIEWADDVLSVIKGSDETECVLGDDWYSVRMARDVTGGFTPELAARFDSFSFDYTAALDYLDPEMTNIDRDIAMVRDLVGNKKLSIFLKAASEAHKPFPDMSNVIAQSERCLKQGVNAIDYYIYRAWPQNYAYQNCLANHPAAFRELSSFVRQNTV